MVTPRCIMLSRRTVAPRFITARLAGIRNYVNLHSAGVSEFIIAVLDVRPRPTGIWRRFVLDSIDRFLPVIMCNFMAQRRR
jgi:hypothetical protein